MKLKMRMAFDFVWAPALEAGVVSFVEVVDAENGVPIGQQELATLEPMKPTRPVNRMVTDLTFVPLKICLYHHLD